MPGVPRKFAEHALKDHPDARPVKQGLRRFDDRRRKAIGKEIICLLAANFICKVIWTDWVANPVLVPKKDTETLRAPLICRKHVGNVRVSELFLYPTVHPFDS